ncbi:MAG TPA: alkaline phosphatase family protein, partial [Bryobacteraceae bacterium]|nr:alkaline phosphatase family protein [Bryobacteraceae bacterium]
MTDQPIQRCLLVAMLACAAWGQQRQAQMMEFRAPAGDRPAARRVGAESILPGGRMIEPLGRQYATGPGAFGLAISPDGKYAVTADGGPDRYSLTILDMADETWRLSRLEAKRRGEKAVSGDEDDWRSVFLGLAWEDGTRLFASEGNSGRVRHVAIPSGRLLGHFNLNDGEWKDSYAADIAYDPEGKVLYVADQANFRVAVFSTRTRKLLASAKVGRLPFKLALSPDRRRLYVTNLGMFEYKVLPGVKKSDPSGTGLPFPAFGFPSEEASKGVQRETARGVVDVPGLGDPNVPESNSLAVLDVTEPDKAKPIAMVRTGEPFGEKSLGGSSPAGVIATSNDIYVANGNQDSISVVDAVTLRLRATVLLRIPKLEEFRGVLPLGMAIDDENGRLMVAEAGINAVGVIDMASNKVIGHLPVGWFPTSVVVRNGQVFVASAKGHGTGPNATKTGRLEESFQGMLRRGTISVFPTPMPRAMPIHTGRVMSLNGFVRSLVKSPQMPIDVHHVVLIVKENRTYDEVFGDREEASNGPLRGAPELARLGRSAQVKQPPGELKTRVFKSFYNLTPNHHALAERFSFSDNFYADSEVSVDGHHWLVGSYPNAWTESSLMASYGGQKDFRLQTSAPGRLQFAQSNSSLHPEEQLEAGALWHHLERNGISFRNFGEGFELAGVAEDPGEKPTGARFATNVPMPDPLYRNTSRQYPGYNMNIPDQYRADRFISEIEERYLKAGRELPRLIYIHLPNDHMTKARQIDGYPFEVSFVADNEYALGRIVEYLSNSPWWRRMAIFVTEDDAQGG